ncbi:NAD-P-binding protein [Lactifluus volemus]|nr:NAD-P-binding protein [Lactifluus volemus]
MAAKYANVVGLDENLPVTKHHDCSHHGGSRGIGQEAAHQYARAGASLVLVSRKQETLNETRAAILKELPDTEVVTFVADVKDPVSAEEAVKVTKSRFGRLDVLVANAGVTSPVNEPLAAKDANEWWNTIEINVRGVYNYLRAGTPAILETKGSIIVVTSSMAHLRVPHSSDYNSSKFILDRIVEFAALDYPELRVFALDPGVIQTVLAEEILGPDGTAWPYDSVSLPAATMLTLSAGKAEWLRGRYWSSNWDLNEGERNWKEKTLKQNGLVNKLFIPA